MIHGTITYSVAPVIYPGPAAQPDNTREVLAIDWHVSQIAATNPDLVAQLGMKFMRAIIRTLPAEQRERAWQRAVLGMAALLADCRSNLD